MTDERQTVTRRDLDEQNIEKVFAKGFAADQSSELTAQTPEPEHIAQLPAIVTARPAFGVDAVEIDASKMMAMAGPLIPAWLRANPGHCWGIIQLSKRWTRYDRRTNSWIHFDPITIAQASYMVKAQDGTESVAFMSVFIRALVDAFAPLQTALRYSWDGEGELRQCTCSGLLRGEAEPHEYTTPPLRQIHPKKSPLWSSDPDRQLAYYASRAWGRLYAAGVLNGVYDEDELEGVERIDSFAKQVGGPATVVSGLQERLRRAQRTAEQREGYREGVVEQGLEPQQAPADAGEPAGAKKAKRATRHRAGPKTRPAARPSASEQPSEDAPSSTEAVQPEPERVPEPPTTPAKQPEPPRNLAQYRQHVRRWLMELTTEQAIEERFASERGLRNRCGVTADDRISMRADYIEPRIQELRRASDEAQRE